MTLIKTVHQIELSSRCNLRCKYCPHPQMTRAKADMDWSTFNNAIDWAAKLGGPELSFTGMGEALLHPEFVPMLVRARERLPHTWFLLATNGVSLVKSLRSEDPELVNLLHVLRQWDVTIFVSTHRPEIAGPALELLLDNNIKAGTNTSFVTSGFDWAGQVEWHGHAAPPSECQYLKQGWATILQNGNVVNCCMDAHGLYPCGNVNDEVLPTEFQPMALCEKCHLSVPAEA